MGTGKTILRALLLSIVLLAVMVLAPQTLSLLKGGFQDASVFKQFTFYILIGVPMLVGVLIIFFTTMYQNRVDSKYGIGIGYSELGEKPSLYYFKRFSQLQIFLLSFIIFSILGLTVALVRQQTFTGIEVLPQQFTAVDSSIYSSLLIPVAENLGAAFVLAFFLIMLRIYAKKYNLSSANFIGFAYIIPIFVGIFGVAWHKTIYSGSDISLLTVFVFWTIGGFISLMTGSFIPFWIMHLTNNLFYDFHRFYSNESLLIFTVFTIILLAITYFFLYKGRLFGRKHIE